MSEEENPKDSIKRHLGILDEALDSLFLALASPHNSDPKAGLKRYWELLKLYYMTLTRLEFEEMYRK